MTVDGEVWENRVKGSAQLRPSRRSAALQRLRGPLPGALPLRRPPTCPSCAWRTANAISERLMRRIAVHDLIMENEPWGGPGPKQLRSWRHLVLTHAPSKWKNALTLRSLGKMYAKFAVRSRAFLAHYPLGHPAPGLERPSPIPNGQRRTSWAKRSLLVEWCTCTCWCSANT